jgi:Electron transfer DM13
MTMKNTFLLLLFSTLIFSCEEEGVLTRDVLQTVIIPENSTPVNEGLFMSTSGINVTGGAKIYQENGQFKVVLDNFSISSGPDLKVYLSKSNIPAEFVNLGNLTTATIYAIPQNVTLSEYKYILIHCQQYNHLFAVAQLK